jgi:hypothetical protein
MAVLIRSVRPHKLPSTVRRSERVDLGVVQPASAADPQLGPAVWICHATESIRLVVLLAIAQACIDAVRRSMRGTVLQYLRWPATREGIPPAARGASAPDGFVGKTPLSILLGEGDTFGVGVLFCAPAVGTPANKAATTSVVAVKAFIVYSFFHQQNVPTTTDATRTRSELDRTGRHSKA